MTVSGRAHVLAACHAGADLDSPQAIGHFIDLFYEEVLDDDLLAPIFLDVAGIELQEHLPLIRAYWEKLLLGRPGYRRHTMNIHRALHARRPLDAAAFDRWLQLFTQTLDAHFCGPFADRARNIAGHIAANMRTACDRLGQREAPPSATR